MNRVSKGNTEGPPTILVAVDGSPVSIRAGAYAAGLARRLGARLLVVYVVSAPIKATLAFGVWYAPADFIDDDVARDVRRQVTEVAADIGVPVEFTTAYGDPFIQVCRLASERKVDAIVLGNSTRASHRIMGSLAVRLVRTGRWPVTTVP